MRTRLPPRMPLRRNIFQTIKEGGPLIITIWLAIIGTSVTMVTLIIQNIMSLRKDKLAPPPLIQALQQTIAAGNYQEAWATCHANKNYLANVLKAGLSRLGRGKEAAEDALAEARIARGHRHAAHPPTALSLGRSGSFLR